MDIHNDRHMSFLLGGIFFILTSVLTCIAFTVGGMKNGLFALWLCIAALPLFFMIGYMHKRIYWEGHTFLSFAITLEFLRILLVFLFIGLLLATIGVHNYLDRHFSEPQRESPSQSKLIPPPQSQD